MKETTEIRTELIQTKGLTFEVDMCGAGEKFAICLHGFPEHSFSWRYQLPLLAGLGYTAWAPNLRGYGNSSRPEKVKDYSIDHLVSDVADLIDASGFKSALLIGHDWGGVIAWSFAIQSVRPIERLIVMNIPHPSLFLKGLIKWPQIFRSWYIFFFQIPKIPELLLGLSGAKPVGDVFYKTAVDKSRFPETVLEVYRENALRPGALTAMINYYGALFREKEISRKRRLLETILEVPTLMIWGEKDAALGKELTYGTEKLVTDFTVRYLPDVSHWVQQEAPEAVNKMIEAWITGKKIPEARSVSRR
jgi:pimeloyl-ACP methyl ester carboxylesterase